MSFSLYHQYHHYTLILIKLFQDVKNQNYKDMQIGYLAINKKGEHGAYAVQPWFNYALHQDGENRMIDSLSYLKK